MSNLYGVPLDAGALFTNYCGGNLGGEHETCVEITQIPGASIGYVLRDGKPEGVGRELRFFADELDDFVRGYARERGLTL
ncbi:DUF397 domain-containing protein [Streptomyces johnsoniae]|uniref:DUF397 domain-containing protein n=1 Tax=Streptomyces johnsoniae TaxID=3075532 RepID=A0ABU2SCP9_9ACTN|nr:DUF397 domain-containing protein [Streptomyces sp. DSM 41886]MDT0446754.1 DUF397 domain-containing protein [Streptomyces sp. DSM 41886]